jgi:hypothetical protein
LFATRGRKEVVRYYVLETSEDPKVKMFIVAEVVHEIDENSDERSSGLAGQIAGTRALILSGAEILLMGEGARILQEWDVGDDESYDAESERIALEPDSEEAIVLRHLRLVKDEKDKPKETDDKDS